RPTTSTPFPYTTLFRSQVATDSDGSKPANGNGVTTDFIRPFCEKPPIQLPASSASVSICEPFRETIELGVGRGRNAMAIWQDLRSEEHTSELQSRFDLV